MVEIRPVETDAEHEVALALNNELFPRHAITIENLRSWLGKVPHRYFIAWDGEAAIGTASAMFEPGREEPFCRNIVRPERRRAGVGSALYDAISAYARERGCEALLAHVDGDQREGLAFAEHRGFAEIGRELRVSLELAAIEPPQPRAPDGIEIVTWAERPELAGGMYDVFREAEPDIPGEEDTETIEYEEWLSQHMRGSGDKAEATFVALAGDEVVGYSKFSLTDAQPTVAFHDLTGVKRAWRQRGIAGALKATQIRWAKEHGYERLETANEERNAPIRKLNERFGYRPDGARILLRGPLSDARP
jgi:GNAT superfamily N-acetyltransferase